jgi:hypothetical protein
LTLFGAVTLMFFGLLIRWSLMWIGSFNFDTGV